MTNDEQRPTLHVSRFTPHGLLIFDLDGTLFRTQTVTLPAVQRSFKAFGLPVPPDDAVLYFVGRPVSAFHAWLREQCPPEQAGALIAAVDRTELELIPETGQLFPGVRETLEALRAAVDQMAICTNGPRAYVERVVMTQGLSPFFDAVRYRKSSADSKPRMVRELLERLPARPALVIGDRSDDVQAAHENGLPIIAAAYGYGAATELAQADAALASVYALPHLVHMLMDTHLPPRQNAAK
jgi:phosphoglycolate phosphatase-like HAD superfamily hydrolase